MSAAVDAATTALYESQDDTWNWDEQSDEWRESTGMAEDARATLLAALPHLTEGLAEVIDGAQREWKAAGRHEPLTAAIARAVTGHLERRITDAG